MPPGWLGAARRCLLGASAVARGPPRLRPLCALDFGHLQQGAGLHGRECTAGAVGKRRSGTQRGDVTPQKTSSHLCELHHADKAPLSHTKVDVDRRLSRRLWCAAHCRFERFIVPMQGAEGPGGCPIMLGTPHAAAPGMSWRRHPAVPSGRKSTLPVPSRRKLSALQCQKRTFDPRIYSPHSGAAAEG